MSEQTRVAYLAEYRAARASGNFQRALDIVLDAIDRDEQHPEAPSLTAEIRGLHYRAAA